MRALARQLKRLGLANLAASLLESGGAFGVLGAQALYLSEPLVGSFFSRDALHSLASSLEDPDEMADLIQILREESA